MVDNNPYGRGGPKYTGSDNEAYAWQALRSMLGRDPTDQEVAQAAPAYQGADRNIANVSGGNAFVANLIKSIQAQSPEQQAQTAADQSQAGATSIEEQFKNLMPILQQNYLDPLNTAIEQQRGTQNKTLQDYISQLSGVQANQNDLLGQKMQSQRDQLMSQLTTGPEGEAFRQKYNNLGLLNSGALNTGLANQFGNLASRQQQDILGLGIDQQNQLAAAYNKNFGTQSNLGLGGLAAQQEALQMPINQGISQYNTQQGNALNLNNALMQRTFNVDDFNQQSVLGQLLAQQSQPSSFEKGLGYAQGVSGILGGAGQGAAGAAQVTSYICLAMIDAGLLEQWQLDELHYHIMPAIWKKGRAFWNYAKHGRELVQAANAAGIDWSEYVDLFYTRVMEERDPFKAVDLYALATKYLCKRVAPDLWDERVLVTSYIDSLPFIPLLFTYKPFLQTVKKVLHMRMLFLYDNPQSRLKWR